MQAAYEPALATDNSIQTQYDEHMKGKPGEPSKAEFDESPQHEYAYDLYSSATTDLHPRISIITSLFKGGNFIRGFLEDITRQTIFDQCELIIINAVSPDNEEPIILKYAERFPNIVYVKLTKDPGLYGVWNLGVQLARGEYCANANVDDRMHPRCYELFLKTIEAHPEVDLVYSDYYFSYKPNETFEENAHLHLGHMPEFSPEPLLRGICLPNNHPLWRRSIHEKYGLFDERFKHVGDYEFWLRMVALGSQFKKVPGVYGMFYVNPHGLSTDSAHGKIISDEHKIINALYKQRH
jgi:glycosyltransferase involved in cell wall biosynthesis